MWTLECEGPLFHHKRLWLRPGTSHLFGRSKQERLRNTESYVLDAKSVSKKHLKLSVSAVKPGTGSQLHTRTEVIVDEFSKLGTTIDNEHISKTTKVLRGDRHVFKVAKYEHALILQWRHVTFNIVNLSRTEKSNQDPLATYRSQLEQLDIKFSQDYVPGHTTHVVAVKRNVPPVLQALIYGKHVVTREYLDAVVTACTELPQNEGEPKAPLEIDFDGSWPDTLAFAPPVANEPKPRPASFLAPNDQRSDIFYGYTFVFCTRQQYEALLVVVNAGSGKAVLYEGYEEGNKSSKEFVAFVKNAAGEKGTGELQDTEKGVVVVRLVTKDKDADTKFVQDSSRQLDLRFIEQNELLDVILTCDTSRLRQRLEEEDEPEPTPRPSAAPSTRATPAAAEPPERPTATRSTTACQAKSRAVRAKSSFKGFDAFDDSDSEDEPGTAPPAAATRSMPQIAEDVEMDDARDLPASAPSRSTRQQPANARKRPTPDPDHDIMDAILPAATAVKRRRLNEGKENADPPAPERKLTAKPRVEREIDVMSEVQKRREAEETRAKEDAEKLKEAMDGMEIIGPANLVQIEEMTLSRSHSASASRISAGSSDRWDPKWEGRPNFKRFRRKGEERSTREKRNRNFVNMEETKRKDFGIGEEYWLEPRERRDKERRERDTQGMSQTLRQEPGEVLEEEEDNTQFRRRGRAGKESQVVVEHDEDEVEIAEESVRTAGRGSQQASKATARKRPAKDPPAKEPSAKKKSWRRADDSDEENEDEFAFPKARRGATGRRR